MALLREALPTFNANEEGGVFIMTSSIAVSDEIVESQGPGSWIAKLLKIPSHADDISNLVVEALSISFGNLVFATLSKY